MSKKVDEVMTDEDNSDEMSQAPRAEPPAERLERRERVHRGTQVGFFGRIGQFLRDVRAEMRRVSWPSANEVKNTVIITLIAVVFFAVYLFLVDRLWAFLLTQLNHLLNWLTGI
ncbi:MAG TPA: preprotein translocase subunit SecE [Pyrinomonadaceae bacterium]|nr:preprotein translocase subunit SecE [Pyrinomonadaceae bacterium]